MHTNDMIAFEHLTVRYPAAKGQNKPMAAVEDVSLTVPQGTVCAIIGPSGCGKSTLLKAVAGLIEPSAGRVRLAGRAADPKSACIGFMPQNYGLLPWQTVRGNILLGCRIRGLWHEGRAADEERLQKLMAELHIEEFSARYPRELSGGQQQRVSLARAFLLRPDILLMDEPFSALDAITREEMQDVFLKLWQQEHITTLLVTHYVEEALYLGQHIVVMGAHPGHIARIIENPLGGRAEVRGTQEFFEMGRGLREEIRRISRENTENTGKEGQA
ncbi:ABC transporter ATP-binding protein [uncultured Mitsuokella sp.]|uniref:ABC transporter ATP-binding protein n=2 Tax=uncultured Mitsuokella sp. TaxID=453120 RepID=UPI0025FDCE8F|nr:ABC transporter ATP-binding protein [uncultured Mitsuokella sp.]